MVDLAPGPRRPRTPPFILANRTVAAVLAALGAARLGMRGFTDTALADGASTRALGATLLVTGAMLVTGARRGATGARRQIGALLGTAIAAVGLVKLLQPAATLPLVGSLGWPRDGLFMLGAALLFLALSFWRARV
jgi:hypothetical protein